MSTRLLKWNARIIFTIINLLDTQSNSRQIHVYEPVKWQSQSTFGHGVYAIGLKLDEEKYLCYSKIRNGP